jgi:hypothetical protein
MLLKKFTVDEFLLYDLAQHLSVFVSTVLPEAEQFAIFIVHFGSFVELAVTLGNGFFEVLTPSDEIKMQRIETKTIGKYFHNIPAQSHSKIWKILTI